MPMHDETKSAKYWYDADAIREAHCQSSLERYEYGHNVKDDPTGKVSALSKTGAFQSERMGDFVNINGRNKRDVWTVATAPCKEAHFATFPPKLIEPCIIAGCPVGGIVLDPFMGAGTVGMVARILNRQYIGLELNPKYIEIARSRIDSPENMLSLADEDEQAQYKMNLI